MNETVVIKEGGLTRRLAPIDKLKVNTTDNKDSTWVSAGKANTGVLHASENGIYIASEDGYEAYSEVIVRVTKDSFEGDTSFDDWDYETPDMDLDNWDPETIEEFENDPEGFDDVFNNGDEWKDIDKPIDIKMDNPKIQDTKISGIDPVTGNEMEVGLDEDGYLTESTLPSSIKIVIPPDKHQYVDGQPILFRGMVVKGYTADGELWTDVSHPDGVIPHSELTFPITTAINESKGWDGEYTDGNGLNLRRMTFGDEKWGNFYLGPVVGVVKNMPGWGSERPMYIGASAQSVAYFTMYNNSLYYYGIDSAAEFAHVAPDDNPFNTDYGYIAGFSKNKWSSVGYRYYDGEQGWAPESTVNPTESSLDNLHPAGQTIPVQYIRSDGEVLEDSFTIEVLPDPDGAHPQVDPSTVEWNHRRYKANEDLGAVEVRHGSVYMEGGAIYDVGAAVRLGMLEPVDNEIVP
jgi:hypothetical protein